MKLNKSISGVVLAVLLSMVPLQAQTYNKAVRTGTWSVYVYGGLSGFYDLRDVPVDADIKSDVSPDFASGVKYNIRPWVRTGFNLGYAPLNAINNSVRSSTTEEHGVTLGDHDDGVRTVNSSVVLDDHYQHLLFGDFNIDLNLLYPLNADGRWNIWIGTGAGFMADWDRGVSVNVVSERIESRGYDHYNVYTHDSVTTSATDNCTGAFYVPVRFSVEFDVSPRWTVGLRGEYKWTSFDRTLMPVGVWSAGVSIACNILHPAGGR